MSTKSTIKNEICINKKFDFNCLIFAAMMGYYGNMSGKYLEEIIRDIITGIKYQNK